MVKHQRPQATRRSPWRTKIWTTILVIFSLLLPRLLATTPPPTPQSSVTSESPNVGVRLLSAARPRPRQRRQESSGKGNGLSPGVACAARRGTGRAASAQPPLQANHDGGWQEYRASRVGNNTVSGLLVPTRAPGREGGGALLGRDPTSPPAALTSGTVPRNHAAQPQRETEVAESSGESGIQNLSVETVNANTAAGFKRRLLASDAQIVAGQELHLDSEGVAELQRWGASRGWKILAAPAVPKNTSDPQTPGCYGTGGVAIAARDFLGIRPPPDASMTVFPGRAAEVFIDIPGLPPLSVTCCYGVSGAGLGKVQLDFLAVVGKRVCQRAAGFAIIAGDFNITPRK